MTAPDTDAPIRLGEHQSMTVAAGVADGWWLNAGDEEVFLPGDQAPADTQVGTRLRVFIYSGHDGEPRATTAAPACAIGEAALMMCVEVTRGGGAYLDWGLPKDLFVPPKEQAGHMNKGTRYVAAVCLDHRGERLIASTRVARHLDYEEPLVEIGDTVQLLVFGEIDAGAQVVVNRRYRGLVHRTQLHKELAVGSTHTGYVGNIREDNRIDIELARRGAEGTNDAQGVLLEALRKAGGKLALHDKSSPSEIQRTLGMSKKAFKRAAGGLYKARVIVIGPDGITLSEGE